MYGYMGREEKWSHVLVRGGEVYRLHSFQIDIHSRWLGSFATFGMNQGLEGQVRDTEVVVPIKGKKVTGSPLIFSLLIMDKTFKVFFWERMIGV